MLFNVYDYSGVVIGQVEASDAVEAWSEAGERFEYILDVREVEEPKYGEEEERQYKEEEHYREKGFRIVHAKVGEPNIRIVERREKMELTSEQQFLLSGILSVDHQIRARIANLLKLEGENLLVGDIEVTNPEAQKGNCIFWLVQLLVT